MSDNELKSEVENLIEHSGYEKTKSLFCPLIKIVSMKHKDIDINKICKIVMETLS